MKSAGNTYSDLTPACLTTFPHNARSARICLSNSSGELGDGVMPSARMRSCTSGIISTLVSSVFN